MSVYAQNRNGTRCAFQSKLQMIDGITLIFGRKDSALDTKVFFTRQRSRTSEHVTKQERDTQPGAHSAQRALADGTRNRKVLPLGTRTQERLLRLGHLPEAVMKCLWANWPGAICYLESSVPSQRARQFCAVQGNRRQRVPTRTFATKSRRWKAIHRLLRMTGVQFGNAWQRRSTPPKKEPCRKGRAQKCVHFRCQKGGRKE